MKDILVTGAGGGMGKATVELLIKSGYRVFALDKTVCEPMDGAFYIQADVTDENSVSSAYEIVKGKSDGLGGIVHLAGIYIIDSLVEIDAKEFERAFKINLGGAYLVNKTFLPLLNRGANIVIVTSELAVRYPLPFTGLYGITKAALDRYAYSLKMELQLNDINVSVVRAGAVDTGMIGDSVQKLERFCQKTKAYSCNAQKFKEIVDKVESRKIPPQKIAERIVKTVSAKKPRFAYSINRNPLLILLDLLPVEWRFGIIKRLIKK